MDTIKKRAKKQLDKSSQVVGSVVPSGRREPLVTLVRGHQCGIDGVAAVISLYIPPSPRFSHSLFSLPIKRKKKNQRATQMAVASLLSFDYIGWAEKRGGTTTGRHKHTHTRKR